MTSTALKAAATGTAVAKQRTVVDWLADPKFQSGLTAVAGKFLQPDRMLRLVVNAINRTPRLAECEPRSVLGAVMASTALGLEPNTVQQQAYLIPYKRSVKRGTSWIDVYECQFQIGYRGFVTLAYRSPLIKSIAADCFHVNDTFEHEVGTKTFLRFVKQVRGERGGPLGAFCHVVLASSAEIAAVLPLDELHKIRSRSESYRSTGRSLEFARPKGGKDLQRAQQNWDETPWNLWFDEMASKSAVKRIAKLLPLAAGEAIITAAELDDRNDARRVDMRQLADPDIARGVLLDGYEAPGIVIDEDEGDEGPGAGDAATPTPPPAPEPAVDPKAAAKSKKAGQIDGPNFDALKRWMTEAKTPDDAAATLDQARSVEAITPEQFAELQSIKAARFPDA